MKEVDFKYYYELKKGEMSFSNIPIGITRSNTFKQLSDAGILGITKAGRGKTVRILNPLAYETFLTTYFPENIAGNTRAANIIKLRNSKAKKRQGSNICFLRGAGKITVNNHTVDLREVTKLYGLFAVYDPNLFIGKLCIIENLETFLNAEKIFDLSYTFLHKYGRIGEGFLNRINVNELLVFSDYDLIGLGEYLKIKESFPQASLYVPKNFNLLFEKYSTPLPEKQVATGRVKNCTEGVVVEIRDTVLKSNRFLEQEVLLIKNES